MKLTYIVGLRQSVRRGAPHRGWSCTRVGVDYNSIIGDYDYGYDDMFFYSSDTIYLIILICHDNGAVQHKLLKIFASTIIHVIYRVQTKLSLKKNHAMTMAITIIIRDIHLTMKHHMCEVC